MSSVLEWVIDRPLVRRLANAGMVRHAKSRVAELDSRPTDASQRQTLLRLVHQARDTRFGRNHDFARIRSLADYQTRVPLRDYEAFWTDYWSASFPRIQGVTWPGAVPYFALSSGTTTGSTKYIPVSREMLASNQRAAVTALGLFIADHPDIPLLNGRLFFLGGSTDLVELKAKSASADDLG
jgi:hypothetical protein